MEHEEELHWRLGEIQHGMDDALLKISKDVALWIVIRFIQQYEYMGIRTSLIIV